MLHRIQFRAPGVAISLVSIAAFIFWPFLFADALLLYKDIGSDSLYSYYPEFVHLSQYVRTVGYPSWSFNVGMGQDLAYLTGYLFWEPITWLPKTWIAPALVWQHLLKILFAGLLFFRFLHLRGLRPVAALLGALLLGFSGYMAIGSCWFPLADEVVGFTALLLGIESALRHGRWLLLALAVAAIGMLNPFFLFLCAIFLTGYTTIWLFAEHGWEPSRIWRVCFILVLVAIAGVSLGTFVTLPFFYVVMHSPRGSGAMSSVSSLVAAPILGFESAHHYFTAIFRMLSNEMVGTGDHFRGWQNYLEAPLTYCGIICLLLVPQILRAGTRARRIAAVALVALIAPTIFPWFRYLFWLFKGDYYRTYSLFCILASLILSMNVFSRYHTGEKLNLPLLAATAAGLLALLYIPFGQAQALIQPSVRTAAALCLLIYAVTLAAGQLINRQQLASYAVVFISALELIYFNRIAATHRDFVTKSELDSQLAANSTTAIALRDIAADDQGFFRLTKPRPAIVTRWSSLNDAMIFDFYGTSSYSSFNNANYTKFLAAVGEIKSNSEVHTRWAVGSMDNPLLSTFLGEKYALIDDLAFLRHKLSYQFVRLYEPNYLLNNQLFLPLGISLPRYITETQLAQMTPADRVQALFRAVVLPDTEADGAKTGLSALPTSQLLQENHDVPLRETITALRESALRLEKFQQSSLAGSIDLDRKSILVLQTPFDSGWRATANGQRVPTLKVDAGLLGVELEPGEHKLELRYRNPYLFPGAIISLAAFLAILAARLRWPTLPVI